MRQGGVLASGVGPVGTELQVAHVVSRTEEAMQCLLLAWREKPVRLILLKPECSKRQVALLVGGESKSGHELDKNARRDASISRS